MLIVGYILGQAQVFNQVRELHNVEVTGVTAPNVFVGFIPYEKGNPLQTVNRTRTFEICPQGDQLNLRTGQVFPVFQFVQERGCQLIDYRTDIEWLRNEQHQQIDKKGNLIFAKEAKP